MTRARRFGVIRLQQVHADLAPQNFRDEAHPPAKNRRKLILDKHNRQQRRRAGQRRWNQRRACSGAIVAQHGVTLREGQPVPKNRFAAKIHLERQHHNRGAVRIDRIAVHRARTNETRKAGGLALLKMRQREIGIYHVSLASPAMRHNCNAETRPASPIAWDSDSTSTSAAYARRA